MKCPGMDKTGGSDLGYNTEAFLDELEEHKEELYNILLDMIRIDSQSFSDGTGREKEFADYFSDLIKSIGYDTDVFSPLEAGIASHADYFDGRHLENRNNCVAVIPGRNHSVRIMLAAHEDTVTVGDPALWSVNPFGEMKDGKIYGRGACDDKYALAVCFYIFKLMKEKGIILPYDVVLAGFSDEENGGSNGALAACLKYPCTEAIMLDGHCMEIVAGGAGGGIVKVTMNCDDALDSCAKMFDAFELLRQEFDSFAEKRKAEFKSRPYFADTDVPDTTVRYTDVHSGMDGSAMNHLEALVTFYTTKTEAETREEWEEMKKNLNRKLKPMHVHVDSFDMITRFFHFTETAENNKAMKLMSEMVSKYTDKKGEPVGMCLSDYPMFTYYATPNAFGFGGGRPFTAEGGAHQADEYIDCNDLLTYTKVLAAFLMNYDS